MEKAMTYFKMIIRNDKESFEQSVDMFVTDRHIVSANFQRNLFYPRADFDESGNPTWGNKLQETYTAFILYEGDE